MDSTQTRGPVPILFDRGFAVFYSAAFRQRNPYLRDFDVRHGLLAHPGRFSDESSGSLKASRARIVAAVLTPTDRFYSDRELPPAPAFHLFAPQMVPLG